jgi:hypothetical protein
MKRSTKFTRTRAPRRYFPLANVLLAMIVGVMPAASFAQCVRQADGSIVCTPRQPVRRFVQAVTPRNERSIVRSYTVAPAQSYGSAGATSYGSAGGVTYSRVVSAGVTYNRVVSAPVVQSATTSIQGDCPCGPDCSCCDDLRAENARLKAELATLRGELAAAKAASAPVKPDDNGWRKVGRVELCPKGWRIVPKSPVLVASK